MELLGRSLYNLIQINLKPDADSTLLDGRKLESWQTDNYRDKSLEQLIQGLQLLELSVGLTDFEQLAKKCESPEDMEQLLTSDQKTVVKERAFLLIFELWRRVCPEKQSLSIFCDELDYQITLYDKGETHSPSDIHDVLKSLLKVLNANLSQGQTPEKAFMSVQDYTANDLESFLYDYIFEEIESANYSYAEELLTGFTKFMKDKKWFNVLSICLESLKDPSAASLKLKELLKNTQKEPSLPFNLEVLHFLAKGKENAKIFYSIALTSLKLVKREEDFEDLLAIVGTFFQSIDDQTNEHLIKNLLLKRAERMNGVLLQSDPDLVALRTLLKKENY